MANDIPEEKSEVKDPSQYIRTYAKDMAALSAAGKGDGSSDKKTTAPTPAPTHGRISPPLQQKAPQPKPAKEKKESVVFAETGEGDFFSKPVPKSEQRDPYQEPVALPSVQEAGEIMEVRIPKEAPPPSASDAPPIPLMPKERQEIEPSQTPVPSSTGSRESILSRLRARVSRDAQMEIQTPREPQPSAQTSYREPVPEEPIRAPEPAPVPTSVHEPLIAPEKQTAPSTSVPEPSPQPEPIPEFVPEYVPETTPVPEPEPIPEPIAPAAETVPVFEQIRKPEFAPSATLYREPIEEVVPPAPPARTPVAPPPPPPSVSESEIPSRFHTYTTDFADHIDNSNASTFSVLAAQADAGRISPAPIAAKRTVPWLPILAGVVLIAGGGIGLFEAAQYVSKLHTVPLATPSAPSLIFVDDRLELKGTGPELVNALAQAATQPIAPGKVLLTYLTEATTSAKGVTSYIPLSGGSLISALQLPAPSILLRNIDNTSTVGIVHAGDESRPFFILRVSSYERTLAGMLTWEPVMWRDMAAFYPLYPPRVLTTSQPAAIGTTTATSTRTASSTPPVVTSAPVVASARAVFDDEVVASHDTRVLHDTAGNVLLLYGYYDKQTLIIARDEAAFTELVNRLSATKVQ